MNVDKKCTVKAMTRGKLAEKAGVSTKTLMNWCVPFREELERLGLKPNSKVLPPHVVRFLAEKLCIDLE